MGGDEAVGPLGLKAQHRMGLDGQGKNQVLKLLPGWVIY